ncbi:MAG TPA: hypothetical protein DDX05_07800 [Deltaproteobacteria bacterium]|nr:hypothetical protein [Deltaproteobacteria bacterium]HBG73508.1 hypothetical protein [Deltaproteobacteria bacterium]
MTERTAPWGSPDAPGRGEAPSITGMDVSPSPRTDRPAPAGFNATSNPVTGVFSSIAFRTIRTASGLPRNRVR